MQQRLSSKTTGRHPTNTTTELTSVSTLALGLVADLNTSTRVNNLRLLHDDSVLVKLDNISSAVGECNLVDFIGVQPDLSLSAFEHGRRKTLLQFKVDCGFAKKGQA